MGFNKRVYTASHGGSGGRNPIFTVRNQTFLDRPTIQEALENKYRRDMMSLGYCLRKVMRNLLRYRKRKSAEGKPPSVHQASKGGQSALKALIEFGYDRTTRSLVCGPQLITSPTLPLGGKSVPRLLDQGGQAYIRSFGGQKVLATFGPRPFVKPSLDATLGSNKIREIIEKNPLLGRNIRGR